MFTSQRLPTNPSRSVVNVPGNDAKHVHVGPQYPREVYRVTLSGAANAANNASFNFPHIQFPRDSYMVAIEGLRYVYKGTVATPTNPGRAPTSLSVQFDQLTAPVLLPPSSHTSFASFSLECSVAFPGDRDFVLGSDPSDALKEFRQVVYYPKDATKLTTLGQVVPHEGLKFNFSWFPVIPHPNVTYTEVYVDLLFYPNPLYHASGAM